MKICYVGGANNIHMQRWVKWFADRGHDVHLITDFPAEIQGVTQYQIGNKKGGSAFGFFRKIIQTRRLVRTIKPDVLHAHYAFGYGTFGAFSGFHPYIVSPWGSDILIEINTSKFIKILVKYALKKADLITSDGDNTIARMIQLGVDSQKIHRVYHGVDPHQFCPITEKEQVKKKLGVPNAPVIISTRHLDPLYDVETLIRSVPLVRKKSPFAQFVIAGDVVTSPPQQKNFLQDLAESLGVSTNVKFIGSIPHSQLPFYLASADVYVSTSLSDSGIAMSTLEAMSCGIAPIVTDVADNKKWITDGVNGFIIPLKNPNMLAEKIIYLIENEDIRRNFGQISRDNIKEKQNYDTEMKKMEELCMKIIKQ